MVWPEPLEGEWSIPPGEHSFQVRHVASRSPAKSSREVERNRVIPARGIGRAYASLTASRGLGEDKILTPWYLFTGVNHPALCITEISWAGKATTQISMSSCLLYLFIIAIKKKTKTKWVNKTGSEEQTNQWAWCCVKAQSLSPPGLGGCHCKEQGVPASERWAAAAGLSEQEREGRGTRHHGTSVHFCTVRCDQFKNASHLPTKTSVRTTAVRSYFGKPPLGARLQC